MFGFFWKVKMYSSCVQKVEGELMGLTISDVIRNFIVEVTCK